MVDAVANSLVASEPGESVTFQLGVSNLGNAEDTYTLVTVSGWPATLPVTIGPVVPGETAVVEVSILVPADANRGDVNATTVTVTSQADPLVTDQVVLTTRLEGYQVYLPISFKP
jgi:uncharacterized membrane protein